MNGETVTKRSIKRPRLSSAGQPRINKAEADKLCSLCKNIPFYDLFGSLPRAFDISSSATEIETPSDKDGDPTDSVDSTVVAVGQQQPAGQKLVHHLGDLISIFKRRRACKFCEFLAQVYEGLIQPYLDNQRKSASFESHLFLTARNANESWYEPAGLVADSSSEARTAWLQVGSTEYHESRSEEPMICISHRLDIATDTQSKEQFVYPRKRMFAEASRSVVDAQLILDWLKICNNNHADACAHAGSSFKRNFFKTKYLDVHSGSTVSEIGDQPYVALSYVWGAEGIKLANRSSTGMTETQPDQFPKIIADAMKFVADIGLNFLWVDLYCINQQDKQAKQEQIANMHLVFECAYLTIIPLDASNMNAGIAGISRCLEYTAQPEVQVFHGTMMATYVDALKTHQGNSPWDQRAWTLQESLLSTRCLYFDSTNIYMLCREEFFHSLLEPDMSIDRSSFSINDSLYWQNGFDIDLTLPMFYQKPYGAFVDNFTFRQLTYQTDALNACHAALTLISTSTGVGFNWGLPIKNIVQALLWQCDPVNYPQRRPQFPSWSWLGWIGRIAYPYFLEERDDYKSEISSMFLAHTRFDDIMRSANTDPLFYHDVDKDHEAVVHMERVGNLDATRTLRVSSTVARFHMARVVSNPAKYPPKQVGIRWTLLDRQGRPLKNDVGENLGDEEIVFQTIEHFCRLNPEASKTIESQGCNAELLFIKYWPAIRDQYQLRNWRYDMVSTLLVTKNSNGTYSREASILMKRKDWLAAHPFPRVLDLQ